MFSSFPLVRSCDISINKKPNIVSSSKNEKKPGKENKKLKENERLDNLVNPN